jgi:hypothetical protein
LKAFARPKGKIESINNLFESTEIEGSTTCPTACLLKNCPEMTAEIKTALDRSDRQLDRGIEGQHSPPSHFSDAGKDFQRDLWMS